MLQVNDVAPEFCLVDENGQNHCLSDYRGKKVVLYFYPKDNTPGCTSQACGYRDLAKDFEAKNAVIIGISKDGAKSHQKFKEKFGLNFTLLCDETTEVMQAYGVWQEKNMYGKKVMGCVRSSFLIDEEGKIISSHIKVKASENPMAMLEEL